MAIFREIFGTGRATRKQDGRNSREEAKKREGNPAQPSTFENGGNCDPHEISRLNIFTMRRSTAGLGNRNERGGRICSTHRSVVNFSGIKKNARRRYGGETGGSPNRRPRSFGKKAKGGERWLGRSLEAHYN